MIDGGEQDDKLICVPVDDPYYNDWKDQKDIPAHFLKELQHFLEHYKDLEPGKWVKVLGWEGKEAAHREILDGIANYEKTGKA